MEQSNKIPKYTIEIKTSLEPFANLRYRKSTVLIMCQDEFGRFLLGAKPYLYPEGIARMLGGGVDKNEDIKIAAQREIKEELNYSISLDKIKPLCDVITYAQSPTNKYEMISHVFYIHVDSKKVSPGDDIKNILYLNEKEYVEMANKLLSLPQDLIYNDKEGHFSWGDFGKVYGFIQMTSLDEFKLNNN